MSYNQGWEEAFKQEKWLLQEVLGEFIVAIHHVGSMAVSGLETKSAVDIAVESTVYPLDWVIVEVLKMFDYFRVAADSEFCEYCFTKDCEPGFCLYWHLADSEAVRRQLRFRDLLLNSLEARTMYDNAKDLLAESCRNNSKEYQLRKTALIESMMRIEYEEKDYA